MCSMLASTESAPFRAKCRCPSSLHPGPLARRHCVLSPVVNGCHASQIHFRQCRGRVCQYGCRATGLVRVPLLAQRGRTTVVVLNEHRGLVASECCQPQGSLLPALSLRRELSHLAKHRPDGAQPRAK